jgi:hypothetical protein
MSLRNKFRIFGKSLALPAANPQYIVLISTTVEGLSREVEQYQRAGWKCQGGVATDSNFRYLQAIVKE